MNIEKKINQSFELFKNTNVKLPEQFYQQLQNISISYNDELLNQMKRLEWKLQSSQEFLRIVDEIWNLYIIYDEKYINEVKNLVKEYANVQLNILYADIFSENRLEERYTIASKRIVKML